MSIQTETMTEIEVTFQVTYKAKIKVSQEEMDKERRQFGNVPLEDLDVVQAAVQNIPIPTAEGVAYDSFEATGFKKA